AGDGHRPRRYGGGSTSVRWGGRRATHGARRRVGGPALALARPARPRGLGEAGKFGGFVGGLREVRRGVQLLHHESAGVRDAVGPAVAVLVRAAVEVRGRGAVAETFEESLRARVVLLDADSDAVTPATEGELLGGADEGRADARGAQRLRPEAERSEEHTSALQSRGKLV